MNARRRSRRPRNKGPVADEQAKSVTPKSEGQKKRKRRKPKPKEADLTAFWGDQTLLPAPPTDLRITTDATALVRSLGRLPLAGHETAAEHYLEPIYNRAVMLASALGAAGDLVEPEDLV